MAPGAGRRGREEPEREAPESTRLPWSLALGVALTALLVRLEVGRELGRTPLFVAPQLDSKEFLLWAESIARGDFRWPALPSHGPGYPYLLGALLAVSGGSFAAVRLAQAVLGALTAAGVAALAARAFGRWPGLIAGLLVACYGPLVLIEVSLLAEGPFVFLLVLALCCLMLLPADGSGPGGQERRSRPGSGAGPGPLAAGSASLVKGAGSARFVIGADFASFIIGAGFAGLALGAAAAVRATALPLVPVLAAVVLAGEWQRSSRAVREGPSQAEIPRTSGSRPLTGAAPTSGSAAARPGLGRGLLASVVLCVAALAVVVPVVVKVHEVTGAWLPVQGVGAFSIFLGNRPGGGVASARLGGEWDLLEGGPARTGATGAAAADRYYLELTKRAIAADPAGFLKTLAAKALWLVQADEIRDSHSYEFFRRESPLLRLLPGFGLLFPLAACGMVVAARRRALPPVLAAYLVVMAVSCLAVIVGFRYRIPLVPALAICAAAAVQALAGWLSKARDGNRARTGATSTGGGSSAPEGCGGHPRAEQGPAGAGHETAGESHGSNQPGGPLLAWRRLRSAGSVGLGGDLVWGGGALLVALALCHLRIHPPSHNLAEEWALSASSLAAGGDLAAAEGALRRARLEDPRSALAWSEEAALRLHEQRWDEAEAAARRAVDLSPDYERPHHQLATVDEHRGDLAGALAELRRAAWLRPDDQPVLVEFGDLLLRRGETAEAEQVYRRLLQLTPDDPGTYLALARIAGAKGDFRSGIQLATTGAHLSPDRPEPWLLLAFLALDARDAPTAEEALSNVRRLIPPGAPQLRFAQARLDLLQGRPGAAAERCRDLLTLYPRFEPAVPLLLSAAAQLGRRGEAESFLRSLPSAPPARAAPQ